MRFTGGVPQDRVEPLQQPLGDGVLELLGLSMHLIPAEAEPGDQVGLQEAVAADHAHGPASSLLGEGDGLVGLVDEQSLLHEASHVL